MLNHPRFASACIKLDGGGYVDCSGDLRLSFAGIKPYTIEAWIYQHDIAGAQTVFSRLLLGGISEYSLSVHDGYVKSYRHVQPWEVRAPTPLQPKRWNHIATSYDGQRLRLYVNGLMVADAPFSSIPEARNVHVLIGGAWQDSTPTSSFNGMIAEVRVWEVARTREQIISDSIRHAQPAAGLVAAYDFTSLPFVERSGGVLPAFQPQAGARPCLCVPGMSLGGAGYADLGTPADLAFGDRKPYTIEGWFSPLQNRLTGIVVSKFDQGRGAEYRVGADGAGGLTSYRDVAPWSIASAPLPSSDYYHFATTFDGAALRLYVNGNLHSVRAFGAQRPVSAATLVGAAFNQGKVDSHFRGQIQNVRFWNRALAEEEIRQSIHDDPVKHAELLANYDFTVDPPQDLTGRHKLELKGDARGGYLMVPLDPASPQAKLGFMLPVTEHQAQPAAVARVRRGSGTNPLSLELEARILVELQGQLSAMDPAAAERLREEVSEAMSRARRELEEDPLLYSVSQRVEDGQVVLTYHAADGDYEIFRADELAIGACTIWWIGFLFHISIGLLVAFGGPYGISYGGVAQAIYQIVRANETAWTILQGVLVTTPASPAAAILVAKVLWEQGLLWPILKWALRSAGWFLIYKAGVLLIACFTNTEVAVAITGVVVWFAQVIQMIATNPCPKPISVGGAVPEAG